MLRLFSTPHRRGAKCCRAAMRWLRAANRDFRCMDRFGLTDSREDYRRKMHAAVRISAVHVLFGDEFVKVQGAVLAVVFRTAVVVAVVPLAL